MKDLIEFIAKSLVEHPDQVEVREYGNGDHIRLELSVAADDMGRVIGKSGKVANSIRTPAEGRCRAGRQASNSRRGRTAVMVSKKNSSNIDSGSPTKWRA